jgi:O-antigen/teichoic acid export membrane protein
MTILKRNIAANFAGSLLQALMALLFIPLYIKFLGIEAYGLIGLFMTMQALFMLLDMGLGATVNREMARLSVLSDKAQEMRDLVRSLEVIYWCIAILIGIAVMALSSFIAGYWVKPKQLSPEVIRQAILIMGLAIAFQWPVSFYSGGLMGLQRQVLLNVVNTVVAAIRWCGAVLVLWLVSPTIYAFFLWQILVSLLHVFLTSLFLWRSLPETGKRSAFQGKIIFGIWRFAAGMSGITVLATLLTQTDKIILSKMLSLEMFGYYTLAGMIAMTLYRLIGPVFLAVYPRFTQLVELNDQEALKQLYHKACQLMSVLILPATAVIAFFSYEILLLWTGNPATAENTYILVSVLIIGTAFNGLMNMPYALQLAHGWTKLGFYVNLVSVILLVPLIMFMAWKYGAIGASFVWVIINCGYVVITIPLMHRRLLTGEKWIWYGKDVGVPMLVAFATAGVGKFIVCGEPSSQMMSVVILILISVVTLGVTAVMTPTTRNFVFNQLMKLKLTYGS